MPTVEDCLAHCKWLIEKGRAQEKAVLYLPRVEAQRRKANKEGYRRVVFQVDEQLYRDWHAQKDRYVEACGGNPAIAYAVMLRCLAQLSTQVIELLGREDEETAGLGNHG